jgi:hypothetical protein
MIAVRRAEHRLSVLDRPSGRHLIMRWRRFTARPALVSCLATAAVDQSPGNALKGRTSRATYPRSTHRRS